MAKAKTGKRAWRWGVAAVLLCAMLPGAAYAQQSTTTRSSTSDEDDPYRPGARTNAAADSAFRQDSAASVTSPTSASGGYTQQQIGDDKRDASSRTESTRSDRDRRSDRDTLDEAEAIRARVLATRRPQQPSEFETYVSTIVAKPLRRFGANLLTPGSRDFTAPPTTTIPSDYRLNAGDEVTIGLTGAVEGNDIRVTVDPQGRVFIPRVGAVNVAGVRYGDLQAVLSRQISRQFSNFRVSVSIAQLHGITVYVTGFAATPGSYTVSSLATVVNAVLAAGGPSTGGSFRSIQVRRGGRLVSDFDLYDLLLRGDKTGDVVLQNGDVLYIAPVGAQVAVIGSVNNEAIFEAAPGETVNDLLLDAGGVNTVADETRALLLDPLTTRSTGWQQLSAADSARAPVSRGLIIRVLSGLGITRPILTQQVLVTISGEVAKPGRYFLRPGSRLADLLAQAGGTTAEAFPYAAVLTRESVRELQQVSFDRALRELQLSLTLKPLTTINSTGTPVATDTSFLQVAQSIVEQLRARRPEGRLVFDLPPTAVALPADLLLENNDVVLIPPRPSTVGVFGAVNGPSSFYFPGTGTIGEFVGRAGGVQKFGDRRNMFVIRANGTVLPGKRALGKPALPGDLVFVPYNTTRGEFWARLRDLAGVLFTGVTAAAVTASAIK